MVQDDVTTRLRERLIGTWALISCVFRSATGETWYPYGTAPRGMLMYDAQGHMIVVLMGTGRPRFASGDVTTGTLDEIRAAFQAFDAYCGTYTLDEDHQVVMHHLEACRFPNFEGTNHQRAIHFDDGYLHMTTLPYNFDGKEWTGVAMWARASRD